MNETLTKLSMLLIGVVLTAVAPARANGEPRYYDHYDDYSYYDYYDGDYDSAWDEGDWFYDGYAYADEPGTYYDHYDQYDYGSGRFDWEEEGLFE